MTRVRLDPKPQKLPRENYPNLRGRPKGSHNKMTTNFKLAALVATANVGKRKWGGEDGLIAYLEHVAEEYPKFWTAKVLSKMIPMNVRAQQIDLTQLILERLRNPALPYDEHPSMIEHEGFDHDR